MLELLNILYRKIGGRGPSFDSQAFDEMAPFLGMGGALKKNLIVRGPDGNELNRPAFFAYLSRIGVGEGLKPVQRKIALWMALYERITQGTEAEENISRGDWKAIHRKLQIFKHVNCQTLEDFEQVWAENTGKRKTTSRAAVKSAYKQNHKQKT